MDPIDPGNQRDPQNDPQPPAQVPEEDLGPNIFGHRMNMAGFDQIFHGGIQQPESLDQLVLTQAQTDELERFFHNNTRYPDINKREVLARTTGLTPEQIQSWFIRRRIIRRQEVRLDTNLIDIGRDVFPWPANNYMLPYLNIVFNPYMANLVLQPAPPPPPGPWAPVAAPEPSRPSLDRETEDQISQLVDNLDNEIAHLKKQLKDEQEARKAVEAELGMARREIEFLKNNSASEVEELINMTAALELNKTGLAEQNTMLQEQVAKLQNLQIDLEAELKAAKVKAPEGAEPGSGGEPDWMQEEW